MNQNTADDALVCPQSESPQSVASLLCTQYQTVGGEGLEKDSKRREMRASAEIVADFEASGAADEAELATVIQAWPALPALVKARILALIGTVRGSGQ